METKNTDLSSLRIDRTSKEATSLLSGKYFKIIAGFLVLAAISYGLYIGWNILFSPVVEVKLTTAFVQTPSQSKAVLTASGYIVAQRKASIASKGTGRLVYLGVVEGDQVKKDQIIGKLENSDILAQLEQAKANLKLYEADLKEAENNFKRQKELFATGVSTLQELELAEAKYNKVIASIEVAKANLLSAEVALENTLIRAPFDGTVLTKNADVGEIVAPFAASVNSRSAVVTIADMSSLQAEVDVSESNIEKIRLNQDCEITLDAYPNRSYPGFVAKIVPTADRSKATVLVKIGFKKYDSRVLPEMSAKVNFLTEPMSETQADSKYILVVPSSAIENRNGKFFVYKVKDKIANEVEVTIGKVINSYTEILSGLVAGDKVIEEVSEKIKDGIKVKVK
ncbi:MAG: efflux RND transporter periplasmic adaptor subunit [Ignavibacteria bacterium]|nr:efflux RND transporter periplasmic adaptor subunit [Ignavibacteria bacterium]